MNTVAIVQARMGSMRLPGKVLADVCGVPMIARQVARLRMCRWLDEIVVAIPMSSSDDELAQLCFSSGWATYRGSEHDVLGRYLGAAEAVDADLVVRVTGDCPLVDPMVIDDCIQLFRSSDFDFVSNNLLPTWPHGLDCEVMSRGTLAIADNRARSGFDREHVTPWITRAQDGGTVFRLGNLPSPRDLSHYRLTVDYPEDLTVIRAIYERFGGSVFFTTAEVIDFLEIRPDLVNLNAARRVPRPLPVGRA